MSDIQNMDPLLTVEEARQYLRLSLSTLARLRKENARPYHIKMGRKIVYRKSELDAYMDDNVVTNTNSGE